MSNKITGKEAEVLGGIIPCCRKDKSKRDYIEVLRAKNDEKSRSRISKIELDIKYDDEMAPS